MDNGASSYRRFLDGDKSGFDEIVDLYHDNLIFFINRYVHDLNAAEDLAADVFVELLVHPNRYNFSVSLKTYLFMIGRCRSLDYLKHISKLKMVSICEIGEPESDGDFEESILIGTVKKEINDALDTLNTDYKTAIHLIYFEEMSYKDAAKVMKKSEKQIDNLIYRAKNSLRSILGKEVADL